MATMANIVIGGGTVKIGSDLGYFKDGISIAPTAEHYFVEGIEGYPGRHRAKRIKEDWSVSFNLIEPTLDNIKLWADVTNAATGGGTVPDVLKFGGDSVTPNERELECGGIVPGGDDYVRTWKFFRAVASGMGETKVTDFEESALPCVYTMMYDSTETAIGQISDAIA